MNNKTLWTIGILCTLLLVGATGIFLFSLYQDSQTPAGQTNGNTNNGQGPLGGSNPSNVTIPSPASSTQTQGGVAAATRSGGSITVADFKKDPETKVNASGSLFYLSGGLTPSPSKTPYSIFYVEADKTFHITLLQEPLRSVRAQAEQTLLKKLSVTEQQACSLVVYVGTPGQVNEYYAGKEIGLSFCPGAEAL